jgi:diguanylate cyclase (GGDEF)-like protein
MRWELASTLKPRATDTILAVAVGTPQRSVRELPAAEGDMRRVRVSRLRVWLLGLVLLAALPGAAVTLCQLAAERDREAVEAQRSTLLLARLMAAEHARLVSGSRELLLSLAQRIAVEGLDSEACSARLAALLRDLPSYANLGLATPDGTVACSAVPLPGPVSIADRPYFQRTLATRDLGVGEYQVGRITGRPTVNLGYPVLDARGSVQGVVFAAIDLAWLSDLAITTRLPVGAELLVIDGAGTVLSRYPEAGWSGRSLHGTALAPLLSIAHDGTVAASGLDGVPRLYSVTPLDPALGGTRLALGLPQAVVYAEVRALARAALLLAAVAGAALILAWFGLDRVLLRPVARLLAATHRLGAGDLRARSGLPHSGHELHQLARSFDAMAEALAQREDEIRHQALHDPLTGLPNRTLFMDRLRHALARVGGQSAVAVVLLNLDRFTLINDSLGHAAGDELLRAVARRLATALPLTTTLARFGGDEFALLLEPPATAQEALATVERLRAALRPPFSIAGHELVGSASFGVSLSTSLAADGAPVTAEALVRAAAVAVSRAKARGGSQTVLFDPSMGAQAAERLDLEADLRRALERQELCLYYQPEVDLASGQIVGMEALVRWQHPARGLIPPTRFIPLAEETGLIVPIGRWVRETACRQLRQWQARFPDRHLVMSVNVSARELAEPALADEVLTVLRATGVEPTHLRLEITETAVMQHEEQALTTLAAIRTIGVQVAVDDFGTGYCSLAYLQRFAPNTLKVDQAFVRGLVHDPRTAAIVQAVVTLAHVLHMDVTAEGVETLEHRHRVRRLGCDRGQGYLFAKPLPVGAMSALLAARAPLPADLARRAS